MDNFLLDLRSTSMKLDDLKGLVGMNIIISGMCFHPHIGSLIKEDVMLALILHKSFDHYRGDSLSYSFNSIIGSGHSFYKTTTGCDGPHPMRECFDFRDNRSTEQFLSRHPETLCHIHPLIRVSFLHSKVVYQKPSRHGISCFCKICCHELRE